MKEYGREAFRVLIVDDEADYQVLIAHALRDVAPQADVVTASTSDEAMARLHGTDPAPDLVLLDIRLPGPSGFEVLRQVKADARLRYIPVVMLTSSELSTDVQRAYELGANGYISKLSYAYDLPTVLSHTMLYWSAMARATV